MMGEYPYSVRGLEAALGISKTEVCASIKRGLSPAIAVKDRNTGRPKANRRGVLEFIVHGLKYVFPAKPGAMQRGFRRHLLRLYSSRILEALPAWLLGVYSPPERRSDPHVRRFVELICEGVKRLNLEPPP